VLLLALVVVCSACGAPPHAGATTPVTPKRYSTTARVERGVRKTVSVSCRPGEQMVGGGIGTSALFEFAAYIEASYPSGARTWSVTGSAPASYFNLEAEVYCVPAVISFGVRTVHASGAPVAEVACPQNTVLLGGGFQGSQPIAESRPQGNGWMSASSGGNSDTSVQTYALCAARHAVQGQVVTVTFNAHSSTHGYAPGGADAVCPDSQIAVGGGFAGGDLIVASQTHGAIFDGWSVTAGGDTDVTVSAVCVRLQG
jgi:hypothetical protein